MIEYSNLNETFITFIIKRFPELKEKCMKIYHQMD